MPRLGIYTYDFRFYHEAIEILKVWKIPFMSLERPDVAPPDVVAILSKPEDAVVPDIKVAAADPLMAVRRSIPRLLDKAEFENLVIGIDPGPYPGIAVFGDGILIEAYECPTLDRVRGDIKSILLSYSYRNSVIKIGNGDMPNRKLIMDSIKGLGTRIFIVDEKNTSFPHKIHDNALSAARIANVRVQNTPEEGKRDRGGRKTAIEREFLTIRKVLS
jgi:hypothetical protein